MKTAIWLLFGLNMATLGFGVVYYVDTQDRIATLEDKVDVQYRETLTTTLAPWHVKSDALREEFLVGYWTEILKLMKEVRK